MANTTNYEKYIDKFADLELSRDGTVSKKTAETALMEMCDTLEISYTDLLKSLKKLGDFEVALKEVLYKKNENSDEVKRLYKEKIRELKSEFGISSTTNALKSDDINVIKAEYERIMSVKRSKKKQTDGAILLLKQCDAMMTKKDFSPDCYLIISGIKNFLEQNVKIIPYSNLKEIASILKKILESKTASEALIAEVEKIIRCSITSNSSNKLTNDIKEYKSKLNRLKNSFNSTINQADSLNCSLTATEIKAIEDKFNNIEKSINGHSLTHFKSEIGFELNKLSGEIEEIKKRLKHDMCISTNRLIDMEYTKLLAEKAKLPNIYKNRLVHDDKPVLSNEHTTQILLYSYRLTLLLIETILDSINKVSGYDISIQNDLSARIIASMNSYSGAFNSILSYDKVSRNKAMECFEESKTYMLNCIAKIIKLPNQCIKDYESKLKKEQARKEIEARQIERQKAKEASEAANKLRKENERAKRELLANSQETIREQLLNLSTLSRHKNKLFVDLAANCAELASLEYIDVNEARSLMDRFYKEMGLYYMEFIGNNAWQTSWLLANTIYIDRALDTLYATIQFTPENIEVIKNNYGDSSLYKLQKASLYSTVFKLCQVSNFRPPSVEFIVMNYCISKGTKSVLDIIKDLLKISEDQKKIFIYKLAYVLMEVM